MAESESGQEKSEEPTEKKLKEGRDKGQVPRSKELNAMAIMVFGSLGFIMFGKAMIEDLAEIMRQGWTFSREELLAEDIMVTSFVQSMFAALSAITPFLILMAVVAIFTPALLGGWVMSSDQITPKFSRINPASGIKRMFSAKALMELLKAVGKVGVVGGAAYIIYVFFHQDLLNLGREPFDQALKHGAWLFAYSFLILSFGLILIASIDVPFQVFQHIKELKMTLQEVRDEMKDTEGKPEVKSKIRQLQQEMAQKRMMEDVPKADVIITNPTHFAVALQYDPDNMAVPKVLAKGKDLIALRIREIAQDNDIEIFEAPPLARALYASCEIQQEIPGHLFYAVAQILAFVFQLRVVKEQGLAMPERPDPYVPEEEK